jgi:2-methylisocitrate lyase-like PEP mutase family enzyme
VALASGVGLAGCSIEDATGIPDQPLYDFDTAVARVTASVAAARALGNGFVLTARTENFLRGNPDLANTIRRLQAFAAAGADVLMAPGLPDLNAVRAVCAALDKPVNFMVGIPGKSFSRAELEAAGVRRISLATSLWRAAMVATARAATEALEHGTFDYLATNALTPDLGTYMRA